MLLSLLPVRASHSWHSLAHTYITPISVSTFTWHSPCVPLSSQGHLPTVPPFMSKFPLHIRTCCHVGLSRVGLRAHPTPVEPHLNLTNDISNNPISEKRSHSEALKIRIPTDLLGRHNLTQKKLLLIFGYYHQQIFVFPMKIQRKSIVYC